MTDGNLSVRGYARLQSRASAVTAREPQLRTREGEPLVITADLSGTLLTPPTSPSASDADVRDFGG